MYSASSFVRYPSAFDKTAETYNYATQAWPGATDETGYSCRVQYVSPPLDIDQTISGTVSAAMCIQESSNLADAYLAYSVRVLQGDTSTERGVLKAPVFSGGEATTGGVTRIVNAVAVTTVNALAGDRIVIELGHRFVSPSAGATAGLLLANPNYTDLPLTDGTDPTNKCAWLELSTTVTFTAGAATGSTAVVGNLGFSGSNTAARHGGTAVIGNFGFAGGATTDKKSASASTGSFGLYGANTAVNPNTNEVTGSFGIQAASATAKRSGTNVAGSFGFASQVESTKYCVVEVIGSLGFRGSNQAAVGTGGTTDLLTWHLVRNNATTGIEEDVIAFTALPTLRLFRPSDLRAWDFADPNQGFKPSVDCVQINALMTARDASIWPGYFDYRLRTNELGVGENVTYQMSASATDELGNRYTSEFDVCYRDGIRQWGGMTAGQVAAVAALPSAAQNAAAVLAADAARIIDGAITLAEMERMDLAALLGNGTVPSGDGTYAFKGQDGTTTRVGGTITGTVRTVTTKDGAP